MIGGHFGGDDGGEIAWDEVKPADVLTDLASVWVEVYPSGKHFYHRRRGYIVIGGQKIKGRWRGGRRKRVLVGYLGRVYGYESISRTKTSSIVA